MIRVLVFVDFWNLQLSWNGYHKDKGNIPIPRIPWGKKLSEVLLSALEGDCEYMGTNVYASIDANETSQIKRFLDKLSMENGYKVMVKERRPSKPVFCKECRKDVAECPHCQKSLKRNNEKGIDTAIVTELLKSHFDNIYDKAILLSGDADFIPAVEYIQEKGKHVIHAGWKEGSFDLKKACWGHFHLDDLMPQLLA